MTMVCSWRDGAFHCAELATHRIVAIGEARDEYYCRPHGMAVMSVLAGGCGGGDFLLCREDTEDSLPDFDGCVDILAAVARQWAQEALVNARLGSFYELHRLADWLGVDAGWLRRQLSEAHLFSVRTK